jgi:hypothetical protein
VSDVATWWCRDRVTLGWLHARRGNTMGAGEGQHWLVLPFKEARRKALLEQESRQMEACGGMAGTGNERWRVGQWCAAPAVRNFNGILGEKLPPHPCVPPKGMYRAFLDQCQLPTSRDARSRSLEHATARRAGPRRSTRLYSLRPKM